MRAHRRLWAALAAVFLALTIASALMANSFAARSQVMRDAGVSTGLQNNTLARDERRDLLLVGTYVNKLIAYKGNEPIWTFDGNGSFVRLVVREELGRVYAGNADNHVYMIDIETGAPLGDINVQRRVFDIDVSRDGETILISAGVNTAKHNLFLYTASGEELYKEQFRTQIKGCALSEDDSAILLINSRGEIQKLDFEGNELGKQKTNYEQISLQKILPGRYVTLGTDGTYTVFDDELNVLRTGKPSVQPGDIPTAIGASADGELILEGTKERYLYIMDGADKQVYSTRLDNSLSYFMPVGDEIYVTGLGDFLLKLNSGALTGDAALGDVAALLKRLTPILAILALFCLLMAIPASYELLRRFAKAVIKHRVAYALLLPTFILLILFNYTPTIMAFTRAFTNWSKNNFQAAQIEFVGLENYRIMFREAYFLRGVANLALLLFTSFVKVLTVPLMLAWMVSMMTSDRKKYAFRFLLVLPIVVPGVVSALLWKQIYDPQIGLINQLLGKLGLEQFQMVWLGNEKTAIWAIIFMGFPFVNAMAFLVYYGGFTSIDKSIFESARIDGAGRGRIFWSIQLPMIGSQIKLILILTFIGGVQDFYPIYLLTGGGPGTSTYVPGLELYLNATTFGRYGYACALGILMFLFIMAGTLLNMRLQADRSVGSPRKGGKR